MLNNKGRYEDVKYRGQIGLELSSNFSIKNKTLYLKIFHEYWGDGGSFQKLIPDKNIVEDQFNGYYKIQCQNTQNFLRLLDYNINIKIIEPGCDLRVLGTHIDGKYKLEIQCLCNEKFREKMKGAQMNIIILTKSSNITILKTTDDSYITEDKSISYNINDFSKERKFMKGMVFQTDDKEFVEMVKITYKYMDVLPSSNSGELTYFDSENQAKSLDLVKKCQVEVRFIP